MTTWTRGRERHEHDFGSDRVETTTYKGHELKVVESDAAWTWFAYVDGEILPRDDRREGAERLRDAEQARRYATAWVDGEIKRHPKGALLAPEFGFSYYQTRQMVAVSKVVDGKFEVEVEDPFESRAATRRRIFRVGQHGQAADWAAKQVAAHLRKSIAEFHGTK